MPTPLRRFMPNPVIVPKETLTADDFANHSSSNDYTSYLSTSWDTPGIIPLDADGFFSFSTPSNDSNKNKAWVVEPKGAADYFVMRFTCSVLGSRGDEEILLYNGDTLVASHAIHNDANPWSWNIVGKRGDVFKFHSHRSGGHGPSASYYCTINTELKEAGIVDRSVWMED